MKSEKSPIKPQLNEIIGNDENQFKTNDYSMNLTWNGAAWAIFNEIDLVTGSGSTPYVQFDYNAEACFIEQVEIDSSFARTSGKCYSHNYI